MSQLVWNAVGQRLHDIGVDRGVLYIDNVGHPWNGLVSVEESPSGGDAQPFYIDGVKYLNRAAKEEFEATISAFYSPVEFDQCDGINSPVPGLYSSQQRRKPFGLSYRSKIGNDVDGVDHGYKIHIIYNALVAPTSRSYSTINDGIDVPLLSWAISTKPIPIPGMMRSAHLVIDSTTASATALTSIENLLYGSASDPSTLPTPEQIIGILLATPAEFSVTDLGNGLFSISGPETDILDLTGGLYTITHDTVVPINADSADISSA